MLKKFEYFLILSIIIGIHLSIPGIEIFRLSRLLMIVYFFLMLIHVNRIRINHNLSIVIILLVFFGIIPYLWVSIFSIDSIITYSINIIQGLLVLWIIIKNRDLHWTMSIIITYGLINIIIGYTEILFGIHLPYANIENYTSTVNNVPLGLFFNQNDFAVFMALFSNLYFFRMIKSNKYKYKEYFVLILSLVLIFATGSVGSYLLTIFFMFFWLIYLIKKYSFLRIISILIIFTLGFFVFKELFGLLEGIFELDYIQYKLLRFDSLKDLISEGRINILLSYINIARENIFGVGIGNLSMISSQLYGVTINPHSFFIEFMLQFGVLGLILFLFIYIISMIKSFKKLSSMKKSSESKNILFALILIFLSFPYWSNIPSRILSGFDVLWVFVGMMFILYNNNQSGKKYE